ncbi:PepSY domain-containing protein [Henriciella sp.]|uniref:PepSY-associated TM helix domain-containing protein n=1 Tax=Henriciella sp. TaxID=1968823 RepID=UPI00261B4563|nr:PepSY-associated TM helix domain-containing protein [Henriciella sp.]
MANSIWPKSNKARVDRSLSAHSVMGLVISALLFIICVSGTAAVFEDEIGWWENPVSSPIESVSSDTAQAAARSVIAEQPETTHLYLYLPKDGWPRFVAGGDDGLKTASASGELTGEYETPWNDFLIHLHYYLTLPTSFGMIVVAIFGVMLVAMAISGFMAHPRVFRDAFRFRNKGQPRLAQADLHNRLSVWTAPFHIAIALTGAMIGLFSIVALVLAQTSYDGDTAKLSEALFGSEPATDESPADLADVGAAMTTLSSVAPEAEPFLVVLHDPGTAGQHITIYGEHTDRLIYGETYNFDAAGDYTGRGHESDGELGEQVFMSTYRLHFGDFGGLAVKAAYALLGLALCIMIASGLNIYLLKRAEAGRAMPRTEAAWSALVWGTPAWLGLTLLSGLLGANALVMTGLFWIGLSASAIACAFAFDARIAGRLHRLVCAASLLAACFLHAIQYGAAYTNPYITFVTLGLAACAVGLTAQALLPGLQRSRKPDAKIGQPHSDPA